MGSCHTREVEIDIRNTVGNAIGTKMCLLGTYILVEEERKIRQKSVMLGVKGVLHKYSTEEVLGCMGLCMLSSAGMSLTRDV